MYLLFVLFVKDFGFYYKYKRIASAGIMSYVTCFANAIYQVAEKLLYSWFPDSLFATGKVRAKASKFIWVNHK